jgi:serine/threonine-protein phosphatase 2B catalytic subunit
LWYVGECNIGSDILWSDPCENEADAMTMDFAFNTARGCSCYYGYEQEVRVDRKEAVNRFLRENNLLSIVRGHEAQLDGYKLHKWNGPAEFPCVITVFSAPNYCDAYKNKGAVIKFSVSS